MPASEPWTGLGSFGSEHRLSATLQTPLPTSMTARTGTWSASYASISIRSVRWPDTTRQGCEMTSRWIIWTRSPRRLPLRSPQELIPRNLSDADILLIVAFLESLSDPTRA